MVLVLEVRMRCFIVAVLLSVLAGCSSIPFIGTNQRIVLSNSVARIPIAGNLDVAVCVIRDTTTGEEFLVLRGCGRNKSFTTIRLGSGK
jgi:hypothetical protein